MIGSLRENKALLSNGASERQLIPLTGIMVYPGGLQVQVAQLRAHQEETQKELSALIPSVLDRAFKGKL